MAERVGQFFGNYQLLRLLGRGAFAEVYLAEHRYLEVPAAIKVLHVRMESEAHEQFRREARTIAHLQHAHIIRVLDFGFQEQTPFLVMEYTPNGTLRTRHPKGARLSLEQIVHYVKQIAPALDYAHQQRVIHRDVKPENMLLNANDEVVLSDFGLAVVQRSLDSLSTQNPSGTPLYMAPEQIRGKPTAASDQYALGVLVYEWLCGEPPFHGALFEVLSQHLHEPPPSLCARMPSLPLEVEDAVFGALAKEPHERFGSVQDFADVLEEVCDATQPLSLRVSASGRSREQISPFDTLPAPIDAPSAKEEDQSSSSTQPLVLTQQRGEKAEALVASEVLSPAAQAYASTQQREVTVSRTNRERLLRKVRAYWITGVFEHSLHGAALITLGLQEQPGAVANPWQLVLQHPTGEPRSLPAGTRIKGVYDAAEGELLILGAPGSGKTTLLLELARDLLNRAEQDEQHPLPVVFNLASWATKQQRLTDWMVEELNTTYQVPRKLGQAWVDGDQILPLLDGLDEVAPKVRTACIETINAYRQEHGLLPLVVCSRSADYLAQSVRLRLGSAVTVQPLSEQQVDDYLARGGEPLRALTMALRQDAELRELASTPLMLSILTLTYHGMPVEEFVQGASLSDRQRQIFEHYVERMLRQRGTETRYTNEQTTHWLSWLAWEMKRQNETVFYIEHLQPTWLSGVRMRRAYDWWAVRFPGILIGILVSLSINSLFFPAALPSFSFLALNTLLGGFVGWMLSAESTIPRPSESNRRATGGTRPRLVEQLGVGVFIGLATGLSAGLINGLLFGLSSILLQVILGKSNRSVSSFQTSELSLVPRWRQLMRRVDIRDGLVIGLLLGLSYGLSAGLLIGLRSTPGGAMIHKLYGLLVGLGYGLSGGLNAGLGIGASYGLAYGLSGGLLSLLLTGKSIDITLTDKLIWSWRSLGRSLFAQRHRQTAWRVMVLIGLTVGPITGVVDGLYNGLVVGFGAGLVAGFICWLWLGLFQGVSSETIGDQHRAIPNQGIRDSARNSFVFGLIGSGIVALSTVLSYGGFGSGLRYVLSTELIPVLVIGLSAGLLAAFLKGGLACLRHSVVRFLLWRAGSIPWNYPRFLDYAAERTLLSKVGGGYIFVHRLLLEYFVSLDGATTLDEVKAQEQQVLPVS